MTWWSRVAAMLMLSLIGAGLYGAVSVFGSGPRWTTDPCNHGRPTGDADLRNGQSFIQDDLWSTRARQFAVWVGPDGTPFAGMRQRCSASWAQVNLASLPGNPLGAPTGSDLHDVYAIAVDRLGYVHIVGNAHSQQFHYIRSEFPGEITTWVTGQMPGTSEAETYPQFTLLPSGTLLFWHREGVAGTGWTVLDALDPGNTNWRLVGTVLDGRPTGESPYLHHIAIDPRSGTIHLMFEWRLGTDVATTNNVGYAESHDGGATWETATGQPLALPLTNIPANTVLRTTPTGSGLVNGGGLTIDARGHPHGIVVFEGMDGSRLLDHLWFDGRRWHADTLDGKLIDGRPAIAGTPDGRVWLLGAVGNQLDAVDVTPGRSHERLPVSPVPAKWEATYDSQELILFGTIESLIPNGKDAAATQVGST